ncbi:MAG: hypothetical protein V1826_03085 [bacterium]
MTHILHHFRRNRSYARHERWGVVAMLAVLTAIVSLGSWLAFGPGKPAASATDVSAIAMAQPISGIPANGKNFSTATITIIDTKTDQPVPNAWVGLKINDPEQRTPERTYNGWYSPELSRAFYQTNARGQVEFELYSRVSGSIDYQVYTADPDAKDSDQYQKLDTVLTVAFAPDESE